MTRPTFRFAPSPNGRLHLGHAYSALLNESLAGRFGGVWLLRIEDIDPVRATPENIAGVLEDLAWLGLDWPRPVRRQSEHLPEYRAGAERLRGAGLTYPCFCSRSDIASEVEAREEIDGTSWPRDPDGSPLYPGICRELARPEIERRLEAGQPHAWRLDMKAALARTGPLTWRSFDPQAGERVVPARPQDWGDVVVVRKEAPTSYHLSVVLDDCVQGVTHVVRGKDLEAATDVHAILAKCLGLPAAPLYHHHPLLTDAHGQKLSKSRDSLSLSAMRQAGDTPAAIRARLDF